MLGVASQRGMEREQGNWDCSFPVELARNLEVYPAHVTLVSRLLRLASVTQKIGHILAKTSGNLIICSSSRFMGKN